MVGPPMNQTPPLLHPSCLSSMPSPLVPVWPHRLQEPDFSDAYDVGEREAAEIQNDVRLYQQLYGADSIEIKEMQGLDQLQVSDTPVMFRTCGPGALLANPL